VEVSAVRKTKTSSWFWAYSRWDVVPALAGLAHLAYLLFLFFAFPPPVVVGVDPAGVDLLGQHFLEYQRGLPQFSS